MNQLEEARHRIDVIDRQMADLYQQRMDAARDVLHYKKANGLPILDAKREQRVIEKNTQYITNPDYLPFYREFMKDVMSNSRRYQQTLMSQDIVAYAGVKGAFAHMVSERLFPGHPMRSCKSFDDVFQAVVNREAQYGVIPFENNNSGLVGEVLDALMKYPVYIHEMADQRIKQCLLGVPGATLKDVQYVYSKDQALAQAQKFLKPLQVQTVAYPNTALAARYVADEQDIHKAAIGARENADLYNLEILAEGIEENPENTTRFVIIGREPLMNGEHFSILFTIKHTSGSLARIIEIIAKYGLNMDSIQSRPIKGRPFEYFFFIEMDGSADAENTRKCLKELKPMCESYKALGTYPIIGERKDEKE
ncbi:chorismate mutase [Catenisphaera adipataccumulans]|jgi:chorismate mutase/prephenate dehydratase|uniref:Bifunctional chorismate mutase/prephenate dehydratase n=1 Tax=Catenisphaera adipataccumulans TaxID=700500 RepID=A0A7W8FWA9_9FIRM|nr:chorismate mutase [Catenisphaera adipataccumulans]MBB5182500.1 chorismate mutase/prephenate dehydratase [Catenisphaera adipataccumulans]